MAKKTEVNAAKITPAPKASSYADDVLAGKKGQRIAKAVAARLGLSELDGGKVLRRAIDGDDLFRAIVISVWGKLDWHSLAE